MRIGIDIHGVLDKYPDELKAIINLLSVTGVNVCVVSGPTRDEIWQEMVKLEIWRDHPIYSVVDFLKEKGTEFSYDEKGTPWCDEETWWDSKARICKEYEIDYLIDDSYKYAPAFELIDADFIHISDIVEIKDG